MATLLPADPKANYLAHADEIRSAIERVLASGHYILGPEVEAFEREFADYHGPDVHAIGVANGTEALELALRAIGVGPGDFVATVANTVTATVSAIQQIGATPVFVEIDPAAMVMDAAALAQTLSTRRVKAVIPVHLYGHPADMPRIVDLAARHDVRVIEDCAQAHGATVAGRKVGTWGDLAAFSFYPTKNLGALGDGGALLTRDADVANRVRMLRQYGWKTRYVAESPGRNSRLDEMQAAILRVKLRHLDAENATRRALAARYLERLTNAELGRLLAPDTGSSPSNDDGDGGSVLTLPVVAPGAEHVFHQFVIRTRAREALREHLLEAGIVAGVLYPVPVYRQPAYADPQLHLPETERACAEVLCLPCHAQLEPAGVDRICAEILRWPAS